MDDVCKFTITLFHSLVVVAFVYLCLVDKETVFSVFSILNNPNENTLNMPKFLVDKGLFGFSIYFFEMLMKSDLLSFKRFGVSLSKADFFFIPVINREFVFLEL